MNISGEYLIDADREQVWRALNDPAILQRCIPGCENLEQVDTNELTAVVKAAVGPVRARFNTRLTLEYLNPPESYTLVGEGKAGATGFGRGSADVLLESVDAGTRLTYTADFKVGGKLAQVGSRLVAGATKKTADDFFGRFAEALGSPDASPDDAAVDDPVQSSAKEGSRAPAAVAVGVVLLILVAWYLLR